MRDLRSVNLKGFGRMAIVAYFNVVYCNFPYDNGCSHRDSHLVTTLYKSNDFSMSATLEKWMAIESGHFHYGLIDDDSSSLIICFVLIKMSPSILNAHCKF